MDKASAKDTFYLAMALGRGKINPAIVNTDIYYTLFLNVTRHYMKDDFDLYQLSQLAMFMCSPQASPYVGDEFWEVTLEEAFTKAIANFKKYEGKINKEVYLDDFLRGLVSFGIRQLGSAAFIEKVETLILVEFDHLSPKMVENALFFFSRVGSGQNYFVIQNLIKKVQDEGMIEKGSFRDHVMLMSVSNLYKLDLPKMWE